MNRRSPMNRSRRTALLAGLGLVSTVQVGCAAAIDPKLAKYSKYGLVDSGSSEEMEERLSSRLEQVQEGEAPAPDVLLFNQTFPEGISVGHGTVEVADGYHHDVISSFVIQQRGANPFFFAPYRKKWRKGVCYWQVPLA